MKKRNKYTNEKKVYQWKVYKQKVYKWKKLCKKVYE